MNIDANKTAFSDSLWARLVQIDPGDVCRRADVNQQSIGIYEIPFLNKLYHASTIDKIITDASGIPVKSGDFVLLLLTYLLNVKDIPLKNEWVSERDLPGGNFFFRGPHALPTTQFLKLFGSKPKEFISMMTSMGATVVSGQGDACVSMQTLPRIPVCFVLWAEDEEFPARFNYLFDPTVAEHFALDVLLALTYSITYALFPKH
jgi:hypothetical protein